MYLVTFTDKHTKEITNKQMQMISYHKSHYTLNRRQAAWLETVQQIDLIRETHRSLQVHRIHQTKDLYDSDCVECYSSKHGKNNSPQVQPAEVPSDN